MAPRHHSCSTVSHELMLLCRSFAANAGQAVTWILRESGAESHWLHHGSSCQPH